MQEKTWKIGHQKVSDFTFEPADLEIIYKHMEASRELDVLGVFKDLIGSGNPEHWNVVGLYGVTAVLKTDMIMRNEIAAKLKEVGLELQGGQN